MHPAYSVLFFTTLSGAGYGLMIWASAALAVGGIDARGWPLAVMLVMGLVMVTAGLLSSTLHLGRPERAMKAFSQWRSSWLSREGVAAVATYVPAGLLCLGWLAGAEGTVPRLVAILLIIGCLATVWCTGMIYASLPTIRAWNDDFVPPAYIALALATGGLLFVGIRTLSGTVGSAEIWLTMVALAAAWGIKTAYWKRIDDARKPLTPGDATGLGALGKVRVLEPPHSQPNYVMREMGYQVARRHAARLRQLSLLTLFIIPIVAMLLVLVVPVALGVLFAIIAVLSAAVGVFAERWLFFAEAQHVVTLYYGAEAA